MTRFTRLLGRASDRVLMMWAQQLLVMFRSRFNEAMPPKLPNLGPQDIERGVTDQPPSPQVENLLCALLALVLNRKKPVEYV